MLAGRGFGKTRAGAEWVRGPQHDAVWCDELCAWRQAEATFDMMLFGLRLGRAPKALITTTPKPIPLLKRLVANPKARVTKGTTFDNLKNLAPGFARDIVARYRGTRLGRQELNAEILEDTPGALWTRGLIEVNRVHVLPDFARIVVAVDPPASIGEKADECGIVAAGITHDGQGIIIKDASERGLSPHGWASRAVALYHELQADRIVAEVNMGGAMVEAIIREVDASVAYRAVHATRAKIARAEPVAALYEQGRVLHWGALPLLEDQMCNFTGVQTAAGASPDRLDAAVWALTDLMLGRKSLPNLRTF